METKTTWTARQADDEARHLAACAVCRNHLRPRMDQKLYAVKNARTRQFVHILVNGKSLEDTLGWPKGEILYAILRQDGAPKGPPMSEEVKMLLRENGEKKKTENKLKRLVRTNTPARLVEREQEKREKKTMATKKKAKVKKGKPDATVKPTKSLKGGGFEAQLPAEFIRRYKGVNYKVARVGNGWQVNDGKTQTIHEAKEFILSQHGKADKAWTTSVFFLRGLKV